MGKKKVAQKSGDQASGDAAAPKAAVKETSKKYERGRAYVNASYNNTVISMTDEKGNVLAWGSAGSLGFTGPKKATPFAASKVVAALAEKLRKSGPVHIEVLLNGVGGGRDSAVRSLANQGFDVLSIKDVTPIPHNGPRQRKVRRI